jgi:hypothetical protein
MAVIGKLAACIRTAVTSLAYPFSGLGDVTLLDYLRVPDVTTEHFDAVIDNTNTHTGRFFEVYWRTLAELAAIAEEISRFSEDVATI